MKAPKFIELNPHVLRDRAKSLSRHHDALVAIYNKKCSRSLSVTRNVCNFPSIEQQRKLKIDQQNRRMLAKFETIYERQLPPIKTKHRTKSLEPSCSARDYVRKYNQEAQRIENENLRLYQRLQKLLPIISKRQSDIQYNQTQRYIHNLSKFDRFGSYNTSPTHKKQRKKKHNHLNQSCNL